jgi:hypothetical protein
MKTYEKSKFWFINNDGSKKEPKNKDIYINIEIRFKSKFPFICNEYITYELINDMWIEQDKHYIKRNNIKVYDI